MQSFQRGAFAILTNSIEKETSIISSDTTALLSDSFTRSYMGLYLNRSSNKLVLRHNANESQFRFCQFTDRLMPVIGDGVLEKSNMSDGFKNALSVNDSNSDTSAFNVGKSRIFKYDSLWTIPPANEIGSLGEFRWNLAVQKLLLLTGDCSQVVFEPKEFSNFEVERSQLSNYISRHELFLTFLKAWKCDTNCNIYFCAERLLSEMRRQKFISKRETFRIMRWMNVLNETGYKWSNVNTHSVKHLILSNILIKRRLEHDANQIKWFPRGCKFGEPDIYQLYRSIYHNSTLYRKFSDVVLIIEFNFPNFEGIPYINFIYKSTFKHIIYCGPKSDIKTMDNLGVDYVSYDATGGGFLFYSCLSTVMQMNLQVDGYLLISDDLLLNLGQIETLDIDNPIMFVMGHERLQRSMLIHNVIEIL